MNTTSEIEANKASTPDEFGENIATSSENVCNDQEGLYNNCNESLPGRSRYGRMIKPKSSTNDANSLLVRCIFYAFKKT